MQSVTQEGGRTDSGEPFLRVFYKRPVVQHSRQEIDCIHVCDPIKVISHARLLHSLFLSLATMAQPDPADCACVVSFVLPKNRLATAHPGCSSLA